MTNGGAGVGEALESGFIQRVRTGTTTDIEFLATRGLSSQKIAFIERELAARRAEAEGAIVTRLTEREAVRAFAEPRTVSAVQEEHLRRLEARTLAGQVEFPRGAPTLAEPFLGPVRPTTDVPTFRATGMVVPREPTMPFAEIGIRGVPTGVAPTIPLARGEVGIGVRPTPELLPSVVEPFEKPERVFGGAEQFLLEKKFTAERPVSLLAEVGLVTIAAPQFAERFVRKPAETTFELGLGASELGRRVVTGEGIPEIGRALEERPGRLLTFIGTEVLLFKGLQVAPKLILKGTDIARTLRLKKLKTTEIIDPKFFAGQTFPTITKGETAGELLAEFKPRLPGEKLPAGFTAAPKPFARETVAGVGTSELPGVFQAPLVSPRFLRISGEAERKLFSLRIFDTFKPTIVRITPKEFRLVPGVSPGQKQLASSLKETQKFFETAPKGVSFVPFLKTEKEAVIPFGTRLIQQDKRFFIKFEGRRVPVTEFRTVGAEAVDVGIDFGKLTSIEDISRQVSRRAPKPTGIITPSTSISFVPRRSSLIFRTQLPAPFPPISRLIPSKDSSRIIPPPVSRRVPPPIDSFGLVPPTSRLTPPPSRLRIIPPPIIPSIIIPIIPSEPTPTPPIPPKKKRRKTAERKKKPKKVKKKKRKVTPIAPSFTAIVAELTGGLPEIVTIGGREIGILPSKLRRL